jgi:hypothetical protein
VRENPELESSRGFCAIDQDLWFHRYVASENTPYECIMLVEAKTFGARMSTAQADTLGIVHQFMRNRVCTPTTPERKNLRQVKNAPHKAWSHNKRRFVRVRAFGVYVLTFSGSGDPCEPGQTITWQSATPGSIRTIDEETLTKLLAFELDPDTLRPLDLRNHHMTNYKKNIDIFEESRQ